MTKDPPKPEAGKFARFLAECKENNTAWISVRWLQDAQTELTKHRWIPVSERLPENDNYVFVVGMSNGYVSTAHYKSKEDSWERYGLKTRSITHWKPIILPEQALKGG